MAQTSTNTSMLRHSIASSLSAFQSSGSAFEILHSISSITPHKTTPVKTLYVLDSSFNPPTKAHIYLARTALNSSIQEGPLRLLLLLAVKNADKAPKPASFEDRCVMMALMAEELVTEMEEREVGIDVGVTEEPFYYRKAEVVGESGFYSDGEGLEQVHIVGFDTIIRIFNPKYYNEPDGMRVLGPFFEKGRIRCHLRDGGEEQRAYLEGIRRGEREKDGVERKWGEKIELVENIEGYVTSSTEARRCVVEEGGEWLGRYVGEGVRKYVLEKGLYEE